MTKDMSWSCSTQPSESVVLEGIRADIEQMQEDRDWHKERSEHFLEKANKQEEDARRANKQDVREQRQQAVEEFRQRATRHSRAAELCAKELKTLKTELERYQR